MVKTLKLLVLRYHSYTDCNSHTKHLHVMLVRNLIVIQIRPIIRSYIMFSVYVCQTVCLAL